MASFTPKLSIIWLKRTRLLCRPWKGFWHRFNRIFRLCWRSNGNIFRKELAVVLSKHTSINDHAIGLEKGKSPSYGPIYSLGPLNLEILKAHLEINFAHGFIYLSNHLLVLQSLLCGNIIEGFSFVLITETLITWPSNQCPFLLITILEWISQAKTICITRFAKCLSLDEDCVRRQIEDGFLNLV